MRKLLYILLAIPFLFTGCSNDIEPDAGNGTKKVTIKLLQPEGFKLKVIDNDNLESEQTIKNIAVFLTEPSSDVITHKYVNSGFTTIDDYRLVTLELDPATLQSRDIYVVTNYGTETFSSVSTIEDLGELTTPTVNKNNNLKPENGFCMYGNTLNFDFNNDTNSPAIVNVVRTCAKYRVTVTFPENPTLSTNNSFVITGAANHTYIIKRYATITPLPLSDYFDFAQPIILEPLAGGGYQNVAYVYEATQVPQIYIYTHINNSAAEQEFLTDLPLPQRNYLYDIKVQIYEGNTTNAVARSSSNIRNFTYQTEISVFDENGNLVEKF